MEKRDFDYLELFGRMLMEQVRDESIDISERILDGRMRDNRSKFILERLVSKPEVLEEIKLFIPRVVDITIGHLLAMVEQEDILEVVIKERDKNINIKQISDGLKGDLLTEDGWIARFSKKPHFESE